MRELAGDLRAQPIFGWFIVVTLVLTVVLSFWALLHEPGEPWIPGRGKATTSHQTTR